MIRGDVWGSGVELAATCDLRVAARDVRITIPPAKLGIVYLPRGVQKFLHLLGPANTAELLYTADPVAAERAKEMGFLNRVVDADELEAETYNLAESNAANAPLSLVGTKRTIRAFLDKTSLTETEATLFDDLRRAAYESRDHAEAKAVFGKDSDLEFEGR